MKQITTTITQRGQVTIPAEVRRMLGVKPRDKVAFTIEDGEVRLAPVSFSLESVYGSVKPSRKPEDYEKVSRTAKEAKAEKTSRALNKA
jgi:AbrB family looped-hinge helix DNA binding protein